MNRFADFDLSIRYLRAEEDELEACLLALESAIGGDLVPAPDRPHHLDLSPGLELTLAIKIDAASNPWLTRYFAGALSADALKQMAGAQRIAIQEWEARLTGELSRLLAAVQGLLGVLAPHLTREGRERALLLSFSLPRAECSVVLNHHGMGPELFGALPSGMMRVLELACEGKLPPDAAVLQLFFDARTHVWKYLFAPTRPEAAHAIDRYIDLENGKPAPVASRDAFTHKFHPSPGDELKFLFNPFRAS